MVLSNKHMLKPLSIFTYYLKNKRKVIPVVLIIALSILGITATAAFTGAINRDIEQQLSFFKNYYTVTLKSTASEATRSGVEQKITSLSGVDHWFKGSLKTTDTPSLFGTSFAYVFFLPKEYQTQFLKTMSADIAVGELPEASANTVALSQNLLLRKQLQLHDHIGQKINKEDFLNGDYEIVGEISSPGNFPFGIGDIAVLQQENSAYIITYFIHPQATEATTVDQAVQDLSKALSGDEVLEIKTAKTVAFESINQFRVLDMILWALNVVTIVVIALSISFLNIIFFMQRANEFGLLAALGYSRGYIVRKTIAESVGMVVVGWLVGVVLAEAVYTIINATVFNAAGVQGLTIFEWRTILFSLPVPIAVIIVSGITVLWKLMRLDPIAIIERRD